MTTSSDAAPRALAPSTRRAAPAWSSRTGTGSSRSTTPRSIASPRSSSPGFPAHDRRVPLRTCPRRLGRESGTWRADWVPAGRHRGPSLADGDRPGVPALAASRRQRHAAAGGAIPGRRARVRPPRASRPCRRRASTARCRGSSATGSPAPAATARRRARRTISCHASTATRSHSPGRAATVSTVAPPPRRPLVAGPRRAAPSTCAPSARLPDPRRSAYTASRWSGSTTPPPRRSRGR